MTGGFSLDASVRLAAWDRQGVDRLFQRMTTKRLVEIASLVRARMK